MIENVFILAGGSGTRLWPASNIKNPKQFLEVKDGKSLILLTIERALMLSSTVKIFIITLKDQKHSIIAECSKLKEGLDRIHILPEPIAKNTAPAISACASYLIEQGRAEEKVLVLTSDHLIQPPECFKLDVDKAGKLADKGYLVTFGIKPDYPATGYGYIEAGNKELDGYIVNSFKEKPDEKLAEEFIEKGNYYWNSGMFVFKINRFWEELEKGSAEIAKVFSPSGKNQNIKNEGGLSIIMDNSHTFEIYNKSPKDSFDYAVMEKCSKSALVPASFSWNDIGSWDEMSELESLQEEENSFIIDSKNNFVQSDIPVVLCGVDDLIVVQKNGSLLICKKGKGQLVKDAVELIKKQNHSKLL
jgi:mannose-1-phosphate guanylyltransferase/mannose-6-phosphate isomerase